MSYVDFDYYSSHFLIKVSSNEFNSLNNIATHLVKQYMDQFIAPWDLKSNIEDYGCNMKDAICYLIEHLQSLGGIQLLNSAGPTDLNIKSIKTEGFEYSYDEETLKERNMYFQGFPFSKISANLIKKELKLNGLMCRKV